MLLGFPCAGISVIIAVKQILQLNTQGLLFTKFNNNNPASNMEFECPSKNSVEDVTQGLESYLFPCSNWDIIIILLCCQKIHSTFTFMHCLHIGRLEMFEFGIVTVTMCAAHFTVFTISAS